MPINDFKDYVNKHIMIVMDSGAKYFGVLSAIRHKQNKICLNKFEIINHNFGFTKSKKDTSREFNCNKISNFAVINDYNDLAKYCKIL